MKCRIDFVTNSSSESTVILFEKLGTDKEIKQELEKLLGWGKLVAERTFGELQSAQQYEEHMGELPEEWVGKYPNTPKDKMVIITARYPYGGGGEVGIQGACNQEVVELARERKFKTLKVLEGEGEYWG